MTLRTRLFLLLVGLAAALVAAQWFWVRSLARDLEAEVGNVAVHVGETVASMIREVETRRSEDGTVTSEVRRVFLRGGAPADARPAGEPSPDGEAGRAGLAGSEPRPEPSRAAPSAATGRELSEDLPPHLSPAAVALLRELAEKDPDGVLLRRLESELDGARVEVIEQEAAAFSWVFDVDDAGSDQRHLVLHLRSEGAAGPEDGSEADARRAAEPPGAASSLGMPAGTAQSAGAGGPPDSGAGPTSTVRILQVPPGPGLAHLERRIPLPESGIRDRLEVFARRSLGGAGLLLGLGVLLAAVISHRVSAPLGRLAAAARQLGSGELGRQVDPGRETGEVGEAIGAFNEMSRRLAALDARARELEQERQLAEIGEIARGLAHALRNPLNALGLAVDALAGPGPDGPPAAEAERARRQIRRVDAAIRSFLVLASEGAGEVASGDVAQLARDVALEASQDAAGRVRVRVEADGPAPLSMVEPELRAVVQALVVNAIEASPDGATVEIRVVAGEPAVGSGWGAGEGPPADAAADAFPMRPSARLRIEVADRGPGLDPRVRERLFSPHVSTKAHGSGMGLFLAHRIVHGRHHGSLELLDRDGGGTIARLELGPRAGAGDPGV